jgi:transcription antitermination factor NusG
MAGPLDQRLQMLATPGVNFLITVSGKPAVIPEAEITAIHRTLQTPLQVEPHPFLRCGDRVRVKSGPLEGIEGILIRKKNLYRLVLSIEMLGQAAAVEVDVSTVERMPRPNLLHVSKVGNGAYALSP